jgi:hypothetical protein
MSIDAEHAEISQRMLNIMAEMPPSFFGTPVIPLTPALFHKGGGTMLIARNDRKKMGACNDYAPIFQ